jgi:radical SAM superfamily enzyme YgiQ (UPF0313 family)
MDGAIVGIESYRDKNVADVKKRDDVYNVRQTVRELISHGRRALGTFMVGFAEDSIEDMRFDIEQLNQEGLFACQLTLLTPFHGTRLYRQMEHLIDEPDLSKHDLYNLVWKHPKMNRDEARDLLAWAQRRVNDPTRIAATLKQEMKDKVRRQLAHRHDAAQVRPS